MLGYYIYPVTAVCILDFAVQKIEIAVRESSYLHIYNAFPLRHGFKMRRNQGNIRFFDQVIDKALGQCRTFGRVGSRCDFVNENQASVLSMI